MLLNFGKCSVPDNSSYWLAWHCAGSDPGWVTDLAEKVVDSRLRRLGWQPSQDLTSLQAEQMLAFIMGPDENW